MIIPNQYLKKLNILPFNSLIQVSILQIMQQSIQGFLPHSLSNEWESNENRRQDPNLAILRNKDDLFVPFARTNFAEKLPLTSFPKIWNKLDNPYLTIIRNKIEFKIKVKKYFIEKLSENFICQRLLCPRCHLNSLN